MALRQDIKPKFETNDIPSQADFYEVFDSFVHKDEDKATLAMIDAGIDDEHYVTPALLRLGLQNIGAITGGGILPYKQHVDNFSGTFINLEWLPIESSVKVFKNGQLLLEGDAQETADYYVDYETATVIFSTEVGDRNIEIDYWYKSSDPIPGNGTDYVDLTTNQTIYGNKGFAEVTDFTGIQIDNGGSNRGLHVINNAAAQGVFIRSTDSGDSLIINDSVTATGTPLKIQKDDVTKFSVDGNGETMATSFVKSGGTSDDILLGDGTTTSLAGIAGGGSVIPVSATVSGIVDNTSLQELGGVDKSINGVRIGKGSGTGSNNTVLGVQAFDANTLGSNNTSIGSSVLKFNTSGNQNVGLGDYSLGNNTTGSYNTGIGSTSLYTNTTGAYNTGVGIYSLYYNTTGSYNTAIGSISLVNNTTGSYNTSIGLQSLSSNQYGNYNVAIGAYALANNVGTSGSNIYGHRSVAIGEQSMYSNTTGNGTAVGNWSLYKQTTGLWNIAIGQQAGGGITTGSGNTIIANEGFVSIGGGISTGSNNLIVAPNTGHRTGITTGSGNVVIGKVTGLAAGASNTITLADGVGNIALSKATTGELIAPNLTTALINSGGNKSLVTKEYFDAITKPYKSYVALLSQTGTNAPVATVLENELAGNIIWTRLGIGGYRGTLTGAFTLNKTMVTISNGWQNSTHVTRAGVGFPDFVAISTYLSGNLTDGLLDNSATSIEIRVYNYVDYE